MYFMRIDVLTIFPQLLNDIFSFSIIKRAINKKLIKIYVHDIKKYGLGKHRKTDDYPYGGGSGMVMCIEPIYKCLEELKSKLYYDEIIFMTPDGKILEQSYLNCFLEKKNIIIICGHYKGIDQRIRDFFVTKEISIGKYVLSGGELPAAVFIDSIVRLIPGVLGNSLSIKTDSFQGEKKLISEPIYTRPVEYLGLKVPKILLSGDFKKIENWRKKQSLKKTYIKYK